MGSALYQVMFLTALSWSPIFALCTGKTRTASENSSLILPCVEFGERRRSQHNRILSYWICHIVVQLSPLSTILLSRAPKSSDLIPRLVIWIERDFCAPTPPPTWAIFSWLFMAASGFYSLSTPKAAMVWIILQVCLLPFLLDLRLSSLLSRHWPRLFQVSHFLTLKPVSWERFPLGLSRNFVLIQALRALAFFKVSSPVYLSFREASLPRNYLREPFSDHW